MKDAKIEQKNGRRLGDGKRNSVFSAAEKSLTLFRSIFVLALQNLRANKLRTFLTLLGIIVGVAAVISVVTIIEGLNKSVASTFSANGSTVFTLSKNPSVITSREEMIKMSKRKDITKDDADAVARLCRTCWRTGWWTRGSETVKSASSSADNVMIRGASGAIFAIEDLQVETGRNWTENEENSAQYVAIVGADIVKNLFNSAAPGTVLGQEIRVHGGVFRIVGVAASQGTIFGVSRDNFVIVPYLTARKVLPARNSLIVDIQVADSADMENAKDEVTTIMRARRGKISLRNGDETEEDEGFAVESSEVFLSLYKDATDNIYLVTIGVSAISLVVGGIVVMNIMLVSVVERTKEIGLRKAVGARRRDILEQFLSEAVIIASIGGLIGVFAGFGLANLISFLVGFPALISYWSIILGVGTSSLVGVASGIYPAWKAAQLNPVDAMRRE
jgi:putative ABC transport system permease protein